LELLVFFGGYRCIDRKALDPAMFMLYEATHIVALRTPRLLARLNDPTEGSQCVHHAGHWSHW